MKITKKVLALLLICILALSVIGCHKKDEIAVTIEGFEFTSAYYMCALINAKNEAQTKVYENLTDEEKEKEIDYFSKKIDKKSFSDWTKDRAIEMLKEIALYKSLCKKADLKLDENAISNAEYSASYYWQYGYSQYFEPNGVSLETYTDYTVDSFHSSLYFEHIYGKGGEKEINSDEVKNKIYDNFIIANTLDVTFSQETAEEKTTIKTLFENYYHNLNTNKTTFEEVYKDYNKVSEETENEQTDSQDPKPLDKYATVLGKANTGYDHEYFEEISKMATDELKLITKENDSGYLLVIKKDIKADPYYLDNLDISARHLIKDDEFKADIEKSAKKLEANINKYAVNQFKVKKIKEPSYS